MMKKYYYFFLLLLTYTEINSQIGIGNPTPNAESILDMRHTNTDNKPLILPHTTNNSPFTNVDFPGTLLYNSNKNLIYYANNSSGGFNAISPWLFKAPFELVYFDDASRKVSIGTTSTKGKLTVFSSSNISTSSSTDGILLIGDKAGTTYDNFLKIDNNEIMVHNGANIDPELTLLKHGGTVKVGTNVSTPGDIQTDINVTGRILEDGHELVPTGSIVMHYSSSVPAGWGLCDGSSYPKVDGKGLIDSPDLSNRFILAGNTSNVRTAAGEDSVTLTTAQLPKHKHNVSLTNTGSTHTHGIGMSNVILDIGCSTTPGDGADGSNDESNISSRSGGGHTHTVNETNRGGGKKHENRPPYYALVFIMKL